MLESSPPLRNRPTGTSATIRSRTERSSRSSSSLDRRPRCRSIRLELTASRTAPTGMPSASIRPQWPAGSFSTLARIVRGPSDEVEGEELLERRRVDRAIEAGMEQERLELGRERITAAELARRRAASRRLGRGRAIETLVRRGPRWRWRTSR